MACPKLRFLLLAAATAMVAAMCALPAPARAFVLCGEDVTKLIMECREYVKKEGPKVEPSAACCAEIRKLDLPCMCRSVPPELQRAVSMEKAIYVAKCCGKPLPSGTKCGSTIVPPG